MRIGAAVERIRQHLVILKIRMKVFSIWQYKRRRNIIPFFRFIFFQRAMVSQQNFQTLIEQPRTDRRYVPLKNFDSPMEI